MDEQLEDELLLHVAAGTDLPTALASLPQRESAAPANEGRGWLAFVLFVAALTAAWLLSR
jgi:hypothetical protein